MGRRGHRRAGAGRAGLVVEATVAAGYAGARGHRRPPSGSDRYRRSAGHACRRAGGGALVGATSQQVSVGKDRATAQAEQSRPARRSPSAPAGAYLLLACRRQRLEKVDTRKGRITSCIPIPRPSRRWSPTTSAWSSSSASVQLTRLSQPIRAATRPPGPTFAVTGQGASFLGPTR
jgi:hypothetical protein